MKKLMYFGLVLVLLGIVLSIGSFIYAVGKDEDLFNEKYEISSFQAEQQNHKIEVDSTRLDLEILPSENDRISIEYEYNEKYPLTFTEEDGTLNLYQKSVKRFFWFNIGFAIKPMKVKMALPKNIEYQIDIKNTTGTVKISELSLSSASIKVNAGEIYFDNISSKTSNINCVAGEINIQNSTLEIANLKVTTGSLKVNNLITSSIIGEVVTGEISGNINGDIKDYQITSKVVVGESNLVNSTGGNKILNMSVTTGSIEINFIFL